MKTMMQLLTVAILAVSVSFFAGCSERPRSEDKQAVSAVDAQQKGIEDARHKDQEAKKSDSAKLQEKVAKNFLAETDKQVSFIGSPDDRGSSITKAVLAAVEGLSPADDNLLYLAAISSEFTESALWEILPDPSTDKTNIPVDTTTADRAKQKVRAAVIEWLVKNPQHLDLVWPAARQKLRQKYVLLRTLRRYEQLLKINYTNKGFEDLRDCLDAHEVIINSKVEESDEKRPDPKAGQCNGVYKKFGIRVQFGAKEERKDRLEALNALWIVKFLERRDADGEAAVAQKFQQLALDYIK